jgi:hypothetical protein
VKVCSRAEPTNGEPQILSKENAMTFANALIYLALIVYILAKRVQGRPIGTPKQLFALPVIVTVIGYSEVSHATIKPVEIAVTVAGVAISLGLGLLRGRADKLSVRDGTAFVQWGAASLALFFGNLAAKLVLDLGGTAASGTASAAESSLVLCFGLTLLAEAVVLWLRSGSLALPPAGRDIDVVYSS